MRKYAGGSRGSRQGTAATGSRERRHSDEERRGEEKMQESASTNQHPHQHQLTEAAQASLGRGVSRSVDSHPRHIILILSLYSSHKYPYPAKADGCVKYKKLVFSPIQCRLNVSLER